MQTKKLIGARIKAARKRLNLKQPALAEKIPGFTVSRVSNYETGNREPDLATLRQLAVALQCSVSYLIGEDDLYSPDERALVGKYRQSDRAGKDALQRVADLSAPYQGTGDTDDKAKSA